MKRIIPILMTLLLLSGCATQSAEKTYRQITMEEAITMMEGKPDTSSSMFVLLRNIAKSIFPVLSILPTNPLAQRISLNCRIKIS